MHIKLSIPLSACTKKFIADAVLGSKPWKLSTGRSTSSVYQRVHSSLLLTFEPPVREFCDLNKHILVGVLLLLENKLHRPRL